MAALYNMPGFRLVRRQAGKLVAFANGEWRRLRPATGPQIRKQTFLPYVQRLPNQKPPRKPQTTPSGLGVAGVALPLPLSQSRSGGLKS